MYVQIDSLSMIYELVKEDVLIDPVKTERYLFNEINDGNIVLCREAEQKALKVVSFPALIKEKWKLEIGKIPKP